MSNQCSIVEYFAEHNGYRCGYCKSSDSNFSHGMWAHRLTVEHYQYLIDRGWRRSGKYCYKPTMDVMCCPQYTIRCAAMQLKLSKSQKTVIKKLNKYLMQGKTKESESSCNNIESSRSNDDIIVDSVVQKAVEVEKQLSYKQNSEIKINSGCLSPAKSLQSSSEISNETAVTMEPSGSHSALNKKIPKPGDGPDKSKPPSKKAKEIRLLKREEKLKQKMEDNMDFERPEKKQKNVEKSLEDFLVDAFLPTNINQLEMKLIRVASSSREFIDSIDESFLLYRKYQMTIHNDSADECDKDNYFNFLVKTPLEKFCPADGPDCGYGSFHHQYRLNGKLIAVGVLDILPKCISSVYFYYDPDYRFLSLGTYASLRELALTRELRRRSPELQYYYMGFYIHSCSKMRYKGQYHPSFLLCPVTYTWHRIEVCIPKLEVAPYSRLEQDSQIVDRDARGDISEVQVLHCHESMPYRIYALLKGGHVLDEDEVTQYMTLVGFRCARLMLLYRS